MARPQRIEYEGAVYHVTARGNDRRTIFADDADREHFLRLLGESAEQYQIRVYLFCLMTNHVHLVVETPRANLARCMHRLQTAYTVRFNRRHRRSGHLMQGRYGAWLVETDAYMLRLSRYVHLNPVFTAAAHKRPLLERIAILRGYPWSSYRAYIGRVRPPVWLDMGPVRAMLSPGGGARSATYRRFVESGIEDIDAAFLEAKTLSGLCIGSEVFRAKIQSLYRTLLGGQDRIEDVAFRRRGTWRSADEILAVVCRRLGIARDALQRRRRNSLDRAIAARMLCDHGGLTRRQIARTLGVGTGGAVGKQLHKLSEELCRNDRLRRRVDAIAAECRPQPP